MSLTTFSGPVQSLNGFIVAAPNTLDGSMNFVGANNAAGVVTTITNATQSAPHTYTIPDAGANAFFVLSTTAPGAVTDNSQFVGINSAILETAGTWTKTRVSQSLYSLVHTAAADTDIISFDINNAIRTAAGDGFRLDSIDVIYSIGTLALNAHSATLGLVSYSNNVAPLVTSVPLTGTLATATQAQPYVTNLAITTPAFNNLAHSHYVFELTVNAAITSDYSFFGLMLHFSTNA
jgi:hypothetical protein